jgi:hypothetical protein
MSKNRDSTCTDNQTIFELPMFDDGDDGEGFNPWTCCGLAHRDPRNCGPSLVMNIFFISGPESREKKCPEKNTVYLLA